MNIHPSPVFNVVRPSILPHMASTNKSVARALVEIATDIGSLNVPRLYVSIVVSCLWYRRVRSPIGNIAPGSATWQQTRTPIGVGGLTENIL